jgi:cellulose synthase (UDP-forming)
MVSVDSADPLVRSVPQAFRESLVVEARPVGPIFDRVVRRRKLRTLTFVPALLARDRHVVAVLAAGWLVSFAAFWLWWLGSAYGAGWAGLIINSLLLLWLTSTSGYYFFAALRLRRVNPVLRLPKARVAFVVTRAPAEQWSLVRVTLQAMLAQTYPHRYDVWLCDEDPDQQTLDWCESNSVRVSCRRDVAAYHRPTWPRRTRCKEGNLAYFYDHWGYQDYDVVAQLDCDHVPRPTYLAAVVAPFTDPAVGYVAAPSVCDANAVESWAARGRLYRDATWQGAVQPGHNGGLAPLCIGSHYAVRTRALREIGGLGPELAEDFSTTFLLISAGWQGAFAMDAEAHGDGPLTVADMLTQEFQWSRSMAMLLYDLVPHHLGRIKRAVRLRLLHHMSFYPLLALTMTTGLALSPIVMFTGRPWVSVNYFQFLAYTALICVWPLALTLLLRRRGLLRPASTPMLSWEAALYTLTRWPYVAWGLLAATLHYVWPRAVTFKVTPKSRSGLEPLPARLITPYVIITIVLSGSARVGELYTTEAGYVFICLVGALCYAVAAVALPALHILESARVARVRALDAVTTAGVPLLIGLVTLLPLAVAAASYPTYAFGVLGW